MWWSDDNPPDTTPRAPEQLVAMFPRGSAHLRARAGGWPSLVLVEESFAGPEIVDGREVSGTGEAIRRYAAGGRVVSAITYQRVPPPDTVDDLLDAAVVTALIASTPESDTGWLRREVRRGRRTVAAPALVAPGTQEHGHREWQGTCAQALVTRGMLVLVSGPCDVLGGLIAEVH